MWARPGRRQDCRPGCGVGQAQHPLSHGMGHPAPAPPESHHPPPIRRRRRDGPRRPPGLAAVAGLRLPQLQLRDGRLPLLARHLIRRLRRRRLRRPPPPLPLPPPARARTSRPRPTGARDQARRLGPLHAPHAHVLIQGRRHHAALGAAARLGHGDPHHRRRVLRLLPRTTMTHRPSHGNLYPLLVQSHPLPTVSSFCYY